MPDYRQMARKAAVSHGIDPDIFERQINAESGFNEDVIFGRRASSAGAQGIAQFMPATAKGMGVNPLDPKDALNGAARLMSSYVKKYGNWSDALTAYNAGPGAVGRGLPKETQGYIATILNGKNVSASGNESDGGSGGGSPGGGTTAAPTATVSSFDSAGYQDATKKMMLARLLASSPDAKTNPLLTLGIVSSAPVNRADFQGTQTVTADSSTPSSPSTSGGGSTLVVGDSLGVGTTPYLKKDLGGSVASDTKVGRPSSQAAAILAQKMASGNYSRVVFDAGTNDGSAKQLAQSIQKVKQAAKGADVYIPTVRGPGAAQKNAVIRKAAGGNVHVVDWAGQSNGLVGGDGIHASGKGYQSRAQMLAEAMGTDGSGGGTVNTSQKGVAKFEGKEVAAWIAPALEYARKQGWKGSINSGFRSNAEQTRIYNSGVRPAAKPGTSNHEFTAFPGGAIDVSDAAQLSSILKRSKYRNKLVWAGSKDPVHFSHPHNGSY